MSGHSEFAPIGNRIPPVQMPPVEPDSDFLASLAKLAGETKLAKMNNHVGSFFVNKDIISHEEVIAIKQALVKALS